MRFRNINFPHHGVTVQVSSFVLEAGTAEYHAILHVEPRGEQFSGQLRRLCLAQQELLSSQEFKDARPVFKRYFLSDATNQQPLIPLDADCSVCCIQQPPLDGSKLAVWLYLMTDVDIQRRDGMVICSHNGYRHLWKMGMYEHRGDCEWQTARILTDYEETLQRFDATLADNCVRTWFYVRDVDTQYAGMVRARRGNFAEQGLTRHTHYIASTGIGGIPADPRVLVQMGAYALIGFEPAQQHYLYAKTHLNPTYEYGVTFERGTRMDFGDRSHVYISGTASINNQGEVMHVGDIVLQTERMWENVEALLTEAGAGLEDIAQIVVYLRDICDYDTVRMLFQKRFPDTPLLITYAPVCRPTWLIEMECIAIKPHHDTHFRDL